MYVCMYGMYVCMSQIYVGRRFYVNAYKGLRHKNYGMDLLVVLGTSTAYFYR